MQTIIVVDGGEVDAGEVDVTQIVEAAASAGVTIVSATLDAAASALAGAAASAEAWSAIVTGAAAGRALEMIAEHGGVSGVVSMSGLFDAAQIDLIGDWPELAILTVARSADRPGLRSAVDAYLASTHAHSDLLVDRETPAEEICSWLVGRMRAQVAVEQVAFASADGWQIHGTLTVPPRAEPVAGVVLLHTGRSDRTAYTRLERLLAEQGLAVLNIDWRGRGASTNLGSYFDLDDDTKFAAWRDALAAFERLAADDRVDATRLAAVGCVHGAEYAVRAAWRDRRVKALVILTGYRPHEPEEEQLLISGDVDVMYVNATGHSITGAAMRDLCRRAPRGRANLIEYPGSAIGYQLFEIDPDLEPRITVWLAEVLAEVPA